jgi:hypothetical protein
LENSRVAGDLRDCIIRKVGRGEGVEDGIDLVVIIDAVWPFHDPLKPGDLAHPWQVAEPSIGKTGIAMIANFDQKKFSWPFYRTEKVQQTV